MEFGNKQKICIACRNIHEQAMFHRYKIHWWFPSSIDDKQVHFPNIYRGVHSESIFAMLGSMIRKGH